MELRNRILRLRLTTGQNSGIVLNESLTGTAIRVQFPANHYVGIVNSGGIPARVGSIPGLGSVDLQTYDSDTGEFDATGITVDCLNFSAAPPGGINGGQYCFVETDVDGNYWITSVEC